MRRVLATIAMAGAAWGQAAFETASIKPAAPDAPSRYAEFRVRNATFTARAVSLLDLIVDAYSVETYQVVEGPKWLASEKYDIEARAATVRTREQFRLMEQTLLVERCHLKFHRETREMAVYGLVPAKGGPKFHEGPPMVPPWPKYHMGFRNLTDVAASFGRFLEMDRPVIDQTGLTGQYTLDVDTSEYMNQETRSGRTYPEFLRLAIPEQLGLKLVPTKAPVLMFVIDLAERAEAN
jgi:bla regulator protein blaR1